MKIDLGKICHKLVRVLNLNNRTIYRRDKDPYLTRHYVFRKPVWWMPSVYIHCFHSSDEDFELHNHPFDYSFSLILSGSYKEEYRVGIKGNYQVKSRILKPGMTNYVPANKFHRVDLLNDKVWTIFISGRKTQDWGFWNRDTDEYVQWEEHERRGKLKQQQTKGKSNGISEHI